LAALISNSVRGMLVYALSVRRQKPTNIPTFRARPIRCKIRDNLLILGYFWTISDVLERSYGAGGVITLSS
jgi:hypothetical protein